MKMAGPPIRIATHDATESRTSATSRPPPAQPPAIGRSGRARRGAGRASGSGRRGRAAARVRAHLDRHAPSRSAAGLRLRQGRDAGVLGLGQRGRRVRQRVRACAADAPVACLDVHGTAAVRAQGPRQPGVRARAGPADAGVVVSRRRVMPRRDSRLPTCCAPETGISQGFSHYDATLPPAAAIRRRPRSCATARRRVAAATTWLNSEPDDRFFVFFHIYEPHAPYTPPARFAQPDPYDGEVAFSDEIIGQFSPRCSSTAGTMRRRSRHGRSRRRAGRSQEKEHGLFVYNETIRVPLIDQAAGRTPRTAPASPSPCSTSICCRRWPALAGLGAACPGCAAANLDPLLTGRGSIALAGHLCRSAVSALSLRLERAHVAHRRALQVHQGAYAPSCTISSATRTNARTSSRPAPRPPRRCGRDWRRSSPDADGRRAVGGVCRGSRAAGRPGLRRHARAALQPAANAESLPDPKDKVGVLVKYREAVDLISARRVERRTRAAAGGPGRQPGHDRRAGFTWPATYVRMGRLRGRVSGVSRGDSAKAR